MYYIRKMWTDLERSLWPGRTAQDDELHPLLVIPVAVLSAYLPHTTPSYHAHQIQETRKNKNFEREKNVKKETLNTQSFAKEVLLSDHWCNFSKTKFNTVPFINMDCEIHELRLNYLKLNLPKSSSNFLINIK
jgi:hypothetical protein